ncbi:multiple epidermal growth factor-like domains protein 10, partial [Ruditapes philippinarum]|uniref:multiple epidermal growth factor-like domains protein 10 n=1 Tax=Ruditapes philippinarum TaxID=129788 RepID=UPI00295BF7A9
MHATGQFVKLQRPKNRDATVICELEIYGECSVGKCGFNCLTECHCKTIEDRVTGVCTSGCEGRWTGPGLECINNCDETHWGEQCTLQCGRCKDFQPCDVLTGYCKSGCQNGTLDTHLCDTECPNGTYGENCTLECSGNCNHGDACRKTDGHCERGCSPGFTDDKCHRKCPRGYYGFNCSSTCSVNCASVYSDCHHINGSCLDGCLPGWEGSPCEKECDAGFWGMNCAKMCGHCLSGTCNARNGECSGGCEAGFKDTFKCDQECDKFSYGDKCNSLCSPECKDICDRVNGTCSNCTSGWKGSKCLQECDSAEWGENCENQCGHCLNGSCDSSDGTCDGGCSQGYKTTDRCTEKCEDGYHGYNCSGVCGNCKPGTTCDKITGVCDEGCSDKYMGSICVEAMIQKSKDTDSFPVAGVVGGLFAAVVVIAILVLGCLLWRRKKRKTDMPHSDVTLDSSPLDDLKGERGGDKQNNVYGNKVDKRDNVYENSIDKQNNVYENSANIQAELALSKASKSNSLKGTLSVPAEEQLDDVYCNAGPVGTKLSETSILVEKLKTYVDKITRNDNNLEKEFKKLPVGLQHPTTVAKNPGNAGKNRYKAMYAYDHCRVILKSLPDNPYSNYINAAFIRGHLKENAYIAAQGPIDFTLDDFWRMIWEKDIQTVVMVTNLVELAKMKCIRYWPDLDERLMYGSVIVQTESEDIFAEFTIRTLTVLHENYPGTVRTVTQFHYTAWPDKDVPRSTTSLLHFWYRVRKHDKEKERPWLVHCSAGVGRTGTFTALDILYDQGMDQGYVDIFGCVRDLRDQRISMVQTK